MDNKATDLCIYRIKNAEETLDTAKLCMEHKRYKEAVAYFNHNYVASYDEALEGCETAEQILESVRQFLREKKILGI